ncbi:MAG: hypothetical protein HFJ84_05890 [Clostridiales bacterium]|nr:hypothetical protein [Clostridiales bacterium]
MKITEYPRSVIIFGIFCFLTHSIFLQTVLDFFIIALSIFFVIKIINRFRRKQEEPKAPPAPTKEEILLTEIRDLIAKQAKSDAQLSPDSTSLLSADEPSQETVPPEPSKPQTSPDP